METMNIADLATHFSALSRVVPLRPIRSEEDYEQAVMVMNALLDAGAANEQHALADLVATLGELVADYDVTHFQLPDVAGVDALRFLMQQHQLTQSDLPEIGTQGVVSEILRGKRELNVRHIRALVSRFHVPASVFI